MGHVVSDEEFVIPRGSDIDLSHYDFQDEEELKKFTTSIGEILGF